MLDHCDDTGLSENTASDYDTTLNLFQASQKPKRVSDLDEDRIRDFINELRQKGRSIETLRKHVRNLSAILEWAKTDRLINSVPELPKLGRRRAKNLSRGRPLKKKEFKELIKAVPRVVGMVRAKDWADGLTCLWLSGLRLGEAISLHWTDETQIIPDVERGVLVVPPELEKSGKGSYCPMADGFADWLENRQPKDGEILRFPRGRVVKTWNAESHLNYVSKTISAIGEESAVVVGETGKPASAHDLRHSFGTRWARKVMPAVLQTRMRHESVQTTFDLVKLESFAGQGIRSPIAVAIKCETAIYSLLHYVQTREIKKLMKLLAHVFTSQCRLFTKLHACPFRCESGQCQDPLKTFEILL